MHPQSEYFLSTITYYEKIISVHMSVTSCPVPKKVTETENFAKQCCQIYFKGDKKMFSHTAVPGEAKPSYVYSILKLNGQSSRITDGQLPCTDNHACFCCMPLPLPPPPPLKPLHFWARRSQATYIQHNLEFHHLSRVGPKQLCALAHLGSTREAGTF